MEFLSRRSALALPIAVLPHLTESYRKVGFEQDKESKNKNLLFVE